MLADHILFIDNEALIVDKPAGLPVDSPRDGGLSVENHLQALMLGYKSWPKPAHRLDRDTSGCLLIGRSDKAHKRLSRAFEDGQVTKRYLAIIDGVPDEPGGAIDMALGKRSTIEDGWRMVPDPAGKPARTLWTVLAVMDGRALIELRPETGRTHQLRVHAVSGIGHAIIGDPHYGKAHAEGMMLHASDLSIARGAKTPIAAHAPFPARFASLGFADPDGK
ncbi:MAG: RNA pseudouridine synthase [Sphingopyxis sp.]